MNIKLKILTVSLIGWMSIANAYEIGDEISNTYHTNVSGNIAASAHTVNTSSYYAIDIYAVSIKPPETHHTIADILKSRSPITIVDKKLWTITLDQLPVSQDVCILNDVHFCWRDSFYCYKPCFSNTEPEIIAIDTKNRKVYLNYASQQVGTGGGPSLLFVADINKKEVKFLRIINTREKGSVSPSGRYFIRHCASIMSVYDSDKKSWFDVNKFENDYSNRDKYIIHDLDVIKWLSDTQFVYIDSTMYFTRPVDPMPFISAKKITYDITTKTRLSEKNITEKEYNELVKGDTESH